MERQLQIVITPANTFCLAGSISALVYSVTIHTDCRVPDSEENADRLDDEPGLVRKLSKRGASLRLKCIGKQESDENPLMNRVIARNVIPPSSLNTDGTGKPANNGPPGTFCTVVMTTVLFRLL